MSNSVKNTSLFPLTIFLKLFESGSGLEKVLLKYLKVFASRHPFFERETVFFQCDFYCQQVFYHYVSIN